MATKIQKFKGQVLNQNHIVSRLVYWRKLNENKEGATFYEEALQFASELAKTTPYSLIQVAGIIAALSPQQAWDVNKKMAIRYVTTGKTTGATKMRLQKCADILNATTKEEICAILNGEKTKAFFLNIIGDLTAVCIDRHAIACAIMAPSNIEALPENFRQLNTKQYQFFAECFKIASAKFNETPAHFQAITWYSVREKRNLRAHQNVDVCPFTGTAIAA